MNVRVSMVPALALVAGLTAGVAVGQTFTLSGPDIAPGRRYVVTDEAVVTGRSTWAPDPSGRADHAQLSGRFESSSKLRLSREVAFAGTDSVTVRYTAIEAEPASDSGPGSAAALRDVLLAADYEVLRTADAMSVTQSGDGAPVDAAASFLRGDALGLFAWQSLRDAIPAGGVAAGESIELTGASRSSARWCRSSRA